MRLTLTVVDPYVGAETDAVVETEPETPVGVLARRLGALTRGRTRQPAAFAGASGQLAEGPAPDLCVGGERLDPAAPVGTSPLREGTLVSLDDPWASLPPEPWGLVEVRVVGGPGAGVVHRLGVGEADVGADPACPVRLDDPSVPRRALRLMVEPSGRCDVTPYDGVDVRVDGRPFEARTEWRPGAQIAVGRVLLELGLPVAPDAALEPSADGAGVDYNRPPRLLPPVRQTRFRLPLPPGDHDKRPLPIILAIAPLIMAVGLAYFFKSPYYLAIGLLSPITVLGSFVTDRRQGKKSRRRELAQYRERHDRIEADAHAALLDEQAARRRDAPDPAELMLTAVGPRRRLWERRRHDPDHLLFRLGTADQPSEVVLEDPAQDEHRRTVTWTVTDVPATVPLTERGVLGIAGRGDLPRSVGRWVVAQAAVLHSPADLQIYLLTDAAGWRTWEWVRWLPHTRPGEGQDAAALVGADTETVARRVAELVAVVTARTRALRDAGSGSALRDPDVLVVLDGARRLRSLPGVAQLLRDGPAVGVYSVCLDADVRLLPEECQAVAAETAGGGLRVQQARTEAVDEVRPDLVGPVWCERVARALAPVRDVGREDDDATIPASARLLDVLALEPPTGPAVAARWQLGGRSTEAMVGISLDGPFAIDLRRDGPHGLIAGTTGAGKSELLQSIVAALAVANRPDAMTFVLVDYKGGSAFKDCVSLPHTVGMVTDLDTHLVERALASLTAELRRREHILAAAGTKDIEDHTDACARTPGMAPLPRLLLVIDEFASMVRDLPDFVTGLVNIAQRGRSLGIHLLLATQRPSGVVSPEIRANTNLRIALRVTDSAESIDVLDAPDAARIAKSTPGRAYVRLGHAALVPFQTGRVGGRRRGAAVAAVAAPAPGGGWGGGQWRVGDGGGWGQAAAADDGPQPWVAGLDPGAWGRPAPRPPNTEQAEDEVTDLSVLVGAIREASAALAVPPQHSPWLPALGTDLVAAELPVPPPAQPSPTALIPVPYGLDDLPGEQRQRPAVLDFAMFGHLLAAGGPRSGRSQLLRTIGGQIGRLHSTADVHLYGLDCGNGALLPLAALPHCGAVVGRTQTERVVRLLDRLAAEVDRRAELLAESGYADLGEQRATAPGAERLAHVVVLLDRWEGFTTTLGELDGGRLTDIVMKLLREGASVGVHLVVTGDRSLLSGRISTTTEDKIAFRLPDRGDFTLIGMSPRSVPDELPPGRAFRNESAMELQVALLSRDASGQGQAAALQEVAAEAKMREDRVPAARRPFRVDVVPTRLEFADAWAMRGDGPPRPLWGLVGVGGDTLAAYGPDLGAGAPTFVVGGPAKSGRSSLLLTMVRSFVAGGATVVAVAPRPSPLRALAGTPGVLAVLGEDGGLATADLQAALAAAPGPAAVVVDDAELLRDCDAADLLDVLARGTPGRGLVLGGSADDICAGFRGWQPNAKKNRQGALLSPQGLVDGDLIGVRVPRSLIGQPVAPGRALVHLGDGGLVTVQVPRPGA